MQRLGPFRRAAAQDSTQSGQKDDGDEYGMFHCVTFPMSVFGGALSPISQCSTMAEYAEIGVLGQV